MAQTPSNITSGVGSGEMRDAQPKTFLEMLPAASASQGNIVRRGNVNYGGWIRIGSTYYDLQSNYAMPHRVLLYNDGSVSAVWTTSPNDQTGFPARGAGYNHANTTGDWMRSDSSRVDDARTGWPNIGVLSDGKEFIIGHEATNGGFRMSKNNTAGSRTFNPSTLILTQQPYKPIWSRTANTGDTIHLICSYTDSAQAGEKRAPTRKGIFAPMVYSRSLDGGFNWDIQHIMLPRYDSTITNNGGADQYAIDARGKEVAVVNGDALQGVILWRSHDAGSTWTRTMADSFPYAPYSAKKLMLDTPFTNDGTVDVILDANNKAHVVWGLSRVLDEDTTDATYSFYPGLQGLVYWNESLGNSKIIASGGEFDRDADGFNTLRPSTYSGLGTGSSIPSGMSTVARLSNTSALRQPNMSIDKNGNIFVTYSVPIEYDIYDLDANFRDIGVTFSQDGGGTWGNSQNITQMSGREDDFASTSRKADNFLHVMWQHDELPGTNLQNNSTAASNHPSVLNTMFYQAIPTSEIINGSIGMQWLLSTQEPNTGRVMVVSQNYPNPFSNNSNVIIYLTTPGDVKVEIRNSIGSLVKSNTVKGLVHGNHVIALDATGLAAGVYTYSLTAGGSTVSKHMIVK